MLLFLSRLRRCGGIGISHDVILVGFFGSEHRTNSLLSGPASVPAEPPLLVGSTCHSDLVARLAHHIPQSWLRPSRRTGSRAVPSIYRRTPGFMLMPVLPSANFGALCRAHHQRAQISS